LPILINIEQSYWDEYYLRFLIIFPLIFFFIVLNHLSLRRVRKLYSLINKDEEKYAVEYKLKEFGLSQILHLSLLKAFFFNY